MYGPHATRRHFECDDRVKAPKVIRGKIANARHSERAPRNHRP